MTRKLAILATTTAMTVGLLGAQGVAGAAPGQSYHGTFTSVTYTSEDGSVTTTPAGGNWNVALHDSTVGTATFNIFVNGVHHLAYGVPGQAVTTTDTGWTFSFPTQAGVLEVTLSGNTLTYDIPDYSLPGAAYADVTYTGQLVH